MRPSATLCRSSGAWVAAARSSKVNARVPSVQRYGKDRCRGVECPISRGPTIGGSTRSRLSGRDRRDVGERNRMSRFPLPDLLTAAALPAPGRRARRCARRPQTILNHASGNRLRRKIAHGSAAAHLSIKISRPFLNEHLSGNLSKFPYHPSLK